MALSCQWQVGQQSQEVRGNASTAPSCSLATSAERGLSRAQVLAQSEHTWSLLKGYSLVCTSLYSCNAYLRAIADVCSHDADIGHQGLSVVHNPIEHSNKKIICKEHSKTLRLPDLSAASQGRFPCCRRLQRTEAFLCNSQTSAQEAVQLLRRLNCWWLRDCPPRLLVILNPTSGSGRCDALVPQMPALLGSQRAHAHVNTRL